MATLFFSEEDWYAAQNGEDRCATVDEAISEFAHNVGAERPTEAWLLTSYNSWIANPFYQGPPVRHPEDDSDLDDDGFPGECAPFYTGGPLENDEVPF